MWEQIIIRISLRDDAPLRWPSCENYSARLWLPVTKLLASPVTVWNRRRCLQLAQRGQSPSDKPVGDHGGLLACSPRVSPIRGSHVSGMKSSKQRVNHPVAVSPRCPRTAINSQRSPPAATCEHEARAGFEPASNAREHPRNA